MTITRIFFKLMFERLELETEIPADSTMGRVYAECSEIETLPLGSFKILRNGRPLKNDNKSLADAGVIDGTKLVVMITKKVDLSALNDYEQAAADLTDADPKRKQLAVLRLRKHLEWFVNELSLDDMERVLRSREDDYNEDERIRPKRLPREAVDSLIDRSVINS